MDEKELSIASVSRIRTILLLIGTVIGYLSFLPPQPALAYSMLFVSLCLSVFGCYLWTKLKNRHWIWATFGLLAPAGYLVVALLKNRRQETPKTQV